MRETHKGIKYVPGAYWKECPVCGFDYLTTELKRRWDGLLVCEKDWDEEPTETKSYQGKKLTV